MLAPHRRPHRRPLHRALGELPIAVLAILICLNGLVVLFVGMKASLESSFFETGLDRFALSTQVAGQDSRKVGGGRGSHGSAV